MDVLERMPVSREMGEEMAAFALCSLLLLFFNALGGRNPLGGLSPLSPSPFPPLQALASASSYGSLETAVPGLRSRLVARQLESVDALVRALQEAL